jgi:CheY-like chemotaxis protein
VNRQLALANDRMVMLRAIAEEAQKSKAAFVAKVSHEFRTPLNMIIGLIDLLVETPEVYGEALPPPLFEDLKIVHRNCEHLSSMVNDVLDLSQAEAGRLALRQERVSLAGIIEDTVTVVGSLVERKGLSLVVDVPPGLPLVYCDPTRIRQVVLNLVSNAARFTERGSITIRAAHEDECLTVSVIDTGPGITPEDATRVFEPFCQGMHSPWRDQGGSGLGLTISKQFIELHGGRIWLESQPGQGATFAFRIPISSPLGPVASPGRWISEEFRWVERTSRPTLQPAPFRPRVVVYDETGELAPALGRWAEQAEVVETRSLSQAAEDLQQYPAHVLLVNAVSPERLWSLADEARRVVPDLPIVTCCVPPRLDRARTAGARDYLVRPVTQSQLWAAIRSLGKQIHRILVVDDDPDVSQLLRRMLLTGSERHTSQQPLEVDTAADGEEALASLRASPPDLVLLDVVLPGMDGWQVLAQISQDATLRDIPVIMVSAQDRAEQQLRSDGLLATLGDGMSISHLLQCTLGVSATLFSPA